MMDKLKIYPAGVSVSKISDQSFLSTIKSSVDRLNTSGSVSMSPTWSRFTLQTMSRSLNQSLWNQNECVNVMKPSMTGIFGRKNARACQSLSSSDMSESLVVRTTIEHSQNGSLYSRFESSNDLQANSHSVEEEIREETGKLVDGGMIYRESFVIRCYEVGVNRTASIESIANLMQEIGCNHAQSVGFSNDGFATTPLMRANRLLWVTTRMHIEMNRYPVWGDIVEMDTWFQGEGHIKSRRDWIIKMANTGEVIGRGTSSWVTMNQDTRRLSKVSPEIQAEYMQFCPNPPRFAFENNSVDKVSHLEDPAESVCSNLRPRRGDLDMNQHVNNVTYIGWMLESIPSKVFEEAELTELTLEYRREVSGGETVESLASLEYPEEAESGMGKKHQFVHLLRLQDSNKEINRGRTVWRWKSFCNLNLSI